MKRLALLLLVLVSPLGCKKQVDKALDTTPGSDEKVRVVPSGKGDLTVRGGEGATQAVRMAAARSVNAQYIVQLKAMIEADRDMDGNLPSAEQIKQSIRQTAPLAALINDEIVILTNARSADGIWAYTQWAQQSGNHSVIMASGVVPMSPAELKQSLEAQGLVVKLKK
jgi:hypothetical protein